jgi:hypothetical protein
MAHISLWLNTLAELLLLALERNPGTDMSGQLGTDIAQIRRGLKLIGSWVE